MNRKLKLLLFSPVILFVLLLFVFIGGEVVRLLWNGLLPSIFGWREITFWQALGLLLLCRILFGGFGRHGFPGSMRRRMAERMGERWERMTPEERERFRQGMRGRCGFGPAAGENKGA